MILPFVLTVDDPALSWLAEGAADMLAINLTGWSEVRVVERRRLAALAHSRRVSLAGPVDLSDALALARDARVGTLILGEGLAHAGTVEIEVGLYDVASGNVLQDPLQVDGSTSEDLRPLFDRIAAQILNLSGAPGVTPDLRGATTSSVQAYREYLQGLQHLYRWELEEAAERFSLAIDHDSTFALAYYRLALANDSFTTFSGTRELTAKLTARAVRHSEGLPWRERQHILAFDALADWDYELARQRYEELISADSSDAEAWFLLAAVEYRDSIQVIGPSGRLRPRGNWNVALRAFLRAVDIDPSFHLGYGQAFEIYQFVNKSASPAFPPGFYAAWQDSIVWLPTEQDVFDLMGKALGRGRDFVFAKSEFVDNPHDDSVADMLRGKAITMAQRWSRAAPGEARPHEVLRDLYLHDLTGRGYRPILNEERARLQAVGDTAPWERVQLGALHLAVGDYDAALSLTHEGLDALDTSREDIESVSDFEPAANLLIARGQPSRALQLEPNPTPLWTFSPERGSGLSIDLERGVVTSERTDSVLHTAQILGGSGARRPELRAAVDSLRRTWSEAYYNPQEIKDLFEAHTYEVEPALLLLGEDAVRDWYAVLDSMPSRWRAYLQFKADSLTVAARSLDQAVSFLLRVRDLRQIGELSHIPGVEVVEPRPATPFQLYLLANVAQGLSRDSLAVGLFERMDNTSTYHALSIDGAWGLLSLSYLHRARSYEALADSANAARYYERFLKVWSDAEPDLQHYADEAREGLDRLQGRR